MNNSKREFILVLFIVLLLAGGLWISTDHMDHDDPNFPKEWDHQKYIQMAEGNPFGLHKAPFGWRVLNPILAKLLPFDLLTSFSVLCFIAICATAVMMYYLLMSLGYSSMLAIGGMFFFFSLGSAVGFNMYDFWLTDPLAFFFITFVLWSIVNQKDILFAFMLALGVAAKENVFFAAPLYYMFQAQKRFDIPKLMRWLYLVLPSIVILIALRVFIPQENELYNIRNLFQTIGMDRIEHFSWDSLSSYTIGTFGLILSLIPFFSIKRNVDYLVRFLPFIALTYLSLLFAVNTGRVIVSAFPAVIVMGVEGMRNASTKFKIDEGLLLILPLGLVVCQMIYTERFTLPFIYEGNVIAIFLMSVLIWKLTSRQAEHPSV